MKDLIRPNKGSKEVPSSVPVVLVTPEQAKEWLDTRYDNERPIRKNKVQSFARDMTQGNWHFNGDVIRFHNETGRLVDGQHRLTAIVESGQAQWFPVVNIPEEARPTIDTGSARGLGDLLHLGGHIFGRELAAIVRRVLIYRDGISSTSGGRYIPTHSEGVHFVEENKEALREAAEVAQKTHRSGPGISPSAFAAAYFLCAKVDLKDAQEIFDKMITGVGLEEGDPALAFRTRAIRHQRVHSMPMLPDDVFRFAIVTFNYTRKGVRLTKLQYPRGGWGPHNVPIPE